MIPEGRQVLWQDGKVVCIVEVGAPIEDAICDHIQLNPADYEKHRQAIPPAAGQST